MSNTDFMSVHQNTAGMANPAAGNKFQELMICVWMMNQPEDLHPASETASS
jgi:hypothetical protein